MQKEEMDLWDRTKGFAACIVRMFAALFNSSFCVFPWRAIIEGVNIGVTAEETTANERANREFLEKALASV